MTQVEKEAEITRIVPHRASVVVETSGRAATLLERYGLAALDRNVLLFVVALEKLRAPHSLFETYRKELKT